MDLKEKNVKSIFDEIGFMNNKRLGRCFQTRRKKYYFDTGTGKVFEVNSNVYYILQKILDNADKEDLLNDSDVTVEALNEVYSSIMQENILKAPVLEGFIGSQITDLEGQLTKHRAQITLELTERCNLRCKYCIYNEGQGGYRNFGNRDMTYEIAKQGIDDLIENSGDDSIYVGFYGGEPLLKFDLMKRCIDYCGTISGKDITYAITTNGTLMTNEIAQYFAKLGRKIHITLSLDGPQAINDKYRVYKNGKGTFSDVLKGLKNLLEAFKDKDTLSLGINTVLSEPTTDNLDKIETFFEELPGLPDNVIYTSSFVATKDKAMDYLGVDSEVEREIFFNSKYKCTDCNSCKYKKDCTTSSSGRTIQRWIHEDVLETVYNETLNNNEVYKQRRGIVEHPFGTIKRSLGYSFFLRRRQENVDAEAASMFITYNFKRLLSMFSTKEIVTKFEESVM